MADIGINEMNEELTFNYTFEQMNELFGKINSSEVFTNEEKQNITKALDLAENSVPKEEGKGLSTEDFTTAYKEKLDANIPVLKKKVVSGTTTSNGNVSLGLTKDKAIVLTVIENEKPNSTNASIVATAYATTSNWNAHITVDTMPFGELSSQQVSLIVYYLDITDCDIPGETVTASSDEAPENDMEII